MPTRCNVWQLPSDDKTLLWYSRAIGAMWDRPINEPTSWRFQGAIHEYIRANDPLTKPTDKLPSPNTRKDFWSQCQHGSWFFLPWHRMYLYFFEQIIAAEVVKLGGPNNWALPYWNYSADLESRLLPPAFRNPNWPDGEKNFLYVAERVANANAGLQFVADANDVDLRPALTQADFSSSDQFNFGGPQTGFSHSGDEAGVLEIVPHGAIHVAVGGSGGWMSEFYTAALDPIFWLHHCNIDRLWEVWLRRDPNHKNPNALRWRSQSFTFYDAAKRKVTMRCSEVLDTTDLGFTYDDVSDPLPTLAPALERAAVEPEMEVVMADTVPPELVGATETSFKVGNTIARIRVPTPAHAAARGRLAASLAEAAPARAFEAAAAHVAQPRVLLKLENLTARGTANSYDVYVNIPEGQDPTLYQERRAGRIDMFGVSSASRASAQHPGSGRTYTLDISDIYQQLSAAPDWDPQNIDLSLVPVREWEGATVTVGRVSLYFA